MMMDGCGVGMVLWPLLFLAVLVVGVWLIVQAVRRGRSSGEAPTSRASSASAARGILEERFARGEIDRDEFEERRRTLDDR